MNMRIITLFESIFILAVLLTPLHACNKKEDNKIDEPVDNKITATISTFQEQIPVLTKRFENQVLQIKLQVQSPSKYTIKKIKINLEGTTDIHDIESIKLAYIGNDANSPASLQFGDLSPAALSVTFSGNLVINKQSSFFRVLIQIKNGINLLHKVNATCELIETDAGTVSNTEETKPKGLRIGTALRQHGDDNVDTYRIPGLTTSVNGSLLAIYDVRRQSSRDLQGDIDIGLSRSVDGGNSWEPMRIVLDRGTWGDLPQKFNGISDACILVDEKSNTIFVAGLWMHGVLDESGKWIEGLTEASTDWNHQWRSKGSQPGFGVKQTSQFLITKSTDDGKSWSEPVNLTQMCKKEYWWLWAPAPGHGITLKDGTLVFPTQGRDNTGNTFSNITWSKDNGKTWSTSNMASHGTTENMVVQLSDGSIMINARDGNNKGNLSTTNGRVISVSSDLGKTWIEHPTSRNALIEPACMASLHKHEYTENGQKKSVLLFSNPNSKTDRNRMTIKVSLDGGATWPEKYWMLLDEKSGRGYSCLTSIDEQTIGILYEGSQADLTFQKINLSELIGN